MDKGVVDIANDLYKTINQPVLTTEISGKVYKYTSPLNDTTENVIIHINGIKGSYHNSNLQPAIANINIEIPALKIGTPNEARFELIANIIRTLLVDNNRQATKGFYFNIENEVLIPELKQNVSYYYNFLLNIQKI